MQDSSTKVKVNVQLFSGRLLVISLIHEESLFPEYPSYCLCTRRWIYSKVMML